jgi:hypothetical protein
MEHINLDITLGLVALSGFAGWALFGSPIFAALAVVTVIIGAVVGVARTLL